MLFLPLTFLLFLEGASGTPAATPVMLTHQAEVSFKIPTCFGTHLGLCPPGQGETDMSRK